MFKIFKKKDIIIVAVLIVTALTFIMCFSALSVKKTNALDANKIRIVLDAGHGGIDSGVTGVLTGVKESELNLSVVKKVESLLISAGMEPILTRTSNAGLYGMATKNLKRKDMEKRRDIINSSNAVLVVSVHMNKYTLSTRRGAQVFYKDGDQNGKTLANCIQQSFNGMEQASRECFVLSGDYYILNCTKIPAVIAECGFLSNPQDEALLITQDYQHHIAYAIFKGIVSYLAQASFKYF